MPLWGSPSEEAVDDFDDYDPTPYSGGYDQALTYGRPLPPSDETCYSISTPGDIDYDRPNYSSNSQSSVYETDEANFGDRYGRPRPKPRIDSQFGQGGDEVSGGRYGSEYGSGNEGRPQRQEYGSEYESGYGGGRPKRNEEDGGYGKKAPYGSGFDRQEEPKRYGEEGYGQQDYSGGGNRRSDEEEVYAKPSYGSADFRRNDEEGYGKNKYGGGGYGGGEYRRSDEEGYGEEGAGFRRSEESVYTGRPSYVKTSYGGEDEGSGRYRKSGYAEDESEGYRKSSYGDGEDNIGYEKPSIYGGQDDVRPKYGNESSYDGENKHSYQKHHHRRDYDEE
ncbi:hypothetical protein KSP39_PZI020927 [Platanthera zijinensis]|uniref:Uncharacterized protein n=1 Tax=Platanthera zijinensis TaxID=2320716 RepID=A0AAP0AY98_9ASPA